MNPSRVSAEQYIYLAFPVWLILLLQDACWYLLALCSAMRHLSSYLVKKAQPFSFFPVVTFQQRGLFSVYLGLKKIMRVIWPCSRSNRICGIIWRRAIKADGWERHVDGVEETPLWEGLYSTLWRRRDRQENWISRLLIRREFIHVCWLW